MKLLAAAAVALGLSFAAITASQAMPASPLGAAASNDIVIQTSGGCGPYGHRGPYGGCRPMGGRGPVVVVEPAAPVVVVRPRVCPYGFRWYAGRCRPI